MITTFERQTESACDTERFRCPNEQPDHAAQVGTTEAAHTLNQAKPSAKPDNPYAACWRLFCHRLTLDDSRNLSKCIGGRHG